MSPKRVLRLALLIGAGLLLHAPASWATPADDIRLARDYYLISDYKTALARLESVLTLGRVSDDLRVEALVLRARCEVGLAGRHAGVDSFCSVLQIRPSWRPPDGETFLQGELAAYHRALDLCGPLLGIPRIRLIEPGTPVNVVYPVDPDLRLSQRPTSRPWYRNPYVLGAAGGVAASVLFLLLDEAVEEPPAALPDFPTPPEIP